mgnify:CR=1 FL=1
MVKKNQMSDYFHGLSAEWKLIRWPKRGLLAKQTVVVLVAATFIAGICIAADSSAISVLRMIG